MGKADKADIFQALVVPLFLQTFVSQSVKTFYVSVSEILKVIAALVKNSPSSPESMEVRRAFLSDMIKLFNNSRENRR